MTPDERQKLWEGGGNPAFEDITLREWIVWLNENAHERCSWNVAGTSDGSCDCWVGHAVKVFLNAADERDQLRKQIVKINRLQVEVINLIHEGDGSCAACSNVIHFLTKV